MLLRSNAWSSLPRYRCAQLPGSRTCVHLRKLESNHNEEALSDGHLAYMGSKKFAEKAAWDFVENEKPEFTLSTVNPVMIFGPVTY